jgi:hypothetical protein
MNGSLQTIWQERFSKVIQPPKNISLKYFFWKNPLNQDSLRLRKEAYEYIILSRLEIPHWVVILNERISFQLILQLEKVSPAPYCIISLTKLGLFDQDMAVYLKLNDGDLRNYLAAHLGLI